MMHDREAKERELALVEELTRQSDRGAAIIGLAWVEEALQAAMQSFLEDDREARERLFRPSGALGTLSAKIDLARLLGMITAVIWEDLHTLRKIRNDFAHSVLAKDNSALSFETPAIREKCLKLKCVAHENIQGARQAFIRACASLNGDFYIHLFFRQKVADGGQIFAPIEDPTRRRVRDAS
jgi:DNA-binding MltR family transcriptional regulator